MFVFCKVKIITAITIWPNLQAGQYLSVILSTVLVFVCVIVANEGDGGRKGSFAEGER